MFEAPVIASHPSAVRIMTMARVARLIFICFDPNFVIGVLPKSSRRSLEQRRGVVMIHRVSVSASSFDRRRVSGQRLFFRSDERDACWLCREILNLSPERRHQVAVLVECLRQADAAAIAAQVFGGPVVSAADASTGGPHQRPATPSRKTPTRPASDP